MTMVIFYRTLSLASEIFNNSFRRTCGFFLEGIGNECEFVVFHPSI